MIKRRLIQETIETIFNEADKNIFTIKLQHSK